MDSHAAVFPLQSNTIKLDGQGHDEEVLQTNCLLMAYDRLNYHKKLEPFSDTHI